MSPTANDRKVLVIGWDAADWRVIEPLIAEDKMPNLKRFMEDGVHGNNSTLNPALSPMLWTSIATGKRPFKHGIHGFSEPTPDGKGVRPITNISRSTKAVWNMLQQCGKRSIVVGWWPSHPAEPIDGVMVSNHYQRAGKLLNIKPDVEVGKPRSGQFGWDLEQWPMQPGTVHPESMAKNLQEFRFHPWEIEAEHVAPFIPNFAKIDQKKDKRLIGFSKTLSDTVSIHGASTALIQLEDWDLMCIYFDGIDHFSHGFMRFHPPRQEWISEEDFENYKGVVEGGYRFHDMMLGATLQLAGEDTTVILLSDHGFHPDHLRPQYIPVEPAGPAIEHRNHGIFLMKGPGIKKNHRIHGAGIMDLCPTVLTLFGLPVGRDMDGKPLVDAFEDGVEVESIESWDDVEGQCGMHDPDSHIDPVESAEAMRQLVELGYIEEPDEDIDVAVRETVRELKYNLAQSYMDAGVFNEAIPLLEGIWSEFPGEHRFGINLISCHRAVEDLDGLTRSSTTLMKNIVEQRDIALDSLEELSTEAARYGIRLPTVKVNEDGSRELLRSDEGDMIEGNDFEDPPKKLTFKIRKTMSYLQPMNHLFTWVRLSQMVLSGNQKDALPLLRHIVESESGVPEPYLQAAASFMKFGHPEEAAAAYRKALELDSENAVAFCGLASALLEIGQVEEALDHALESTDLLFHNPRAHLVIGRSLIRLGNLDMATTALGLALKQASAFAEAHDAMADLLEDHLGDPEGAERHREDARQARESVRSRSTLEDETDLDAVQAGIDRRRQDRLQAGGNREDWSDVPRDEIITIVSGLPRSGTSMMMQMLHHGGIEPFVDGEREADRDNPKGYYEHEKSTQLASDSSWIPEVRGRCVKIMAQLLPMLPTDQKYRVVFMDRDLREIARSQRTMLDRLGNKGADISEARLMATLDAQVAAIELSMSESKNIQCLHLDYGATIADPQGAARMLDDFLGGSLDVGGMVAAVDPSLRRQSMSG
ncbi:MAG: alkaline phosphatase family protein [Phycisphaerales bacterium]|nr:alkaline phosphatase family protein [Phycisphaerales bacterium]